MAVSVKEYIFVSVYYKAAMCLLSTVSQTEFWKNIDLYRVK